MLAFWAFWEWVVVFFLQQELSDLKGGRYFTYYSRMYSVRKLSSVPSSRNFLHLNLMHHFEFIFLLSWPLFVWHSVQLFTFFCPNMFHTRLRKFGKSSSKMSYENILGQNRHCAQQLGLVFKARTYSTYIQILRQKGGTRWIIQPNIFCWGQLKSLIRESRNFPVKTLFIKQPQKNSKQN